MDVNYKRKRTLCIYLLRQIWNMDEVYQGIEWTFREQNKVADYFAKMAQALPTRREFHRVKDLSNPIRKCIFHGRIGLPVFHSACN